jgi:hypothetical protein
MSKYFNFILISLFIISCSKKSTPSSSLYEVIYTSEYGGTAFEFYEIFTDEKEFRLLIDNADLRKKIKPDDIKKANFIILNMGQMSTGGYSIGVKKIVNTKDEFQIHILKKSPRPNEIVNQAITNPITILKINSKKKINFIE